MGNTTLATNAHGAHFSTKASGAARIPPRISKASAIMMLVTNHPYQFTHGIPK